MQSPQPLSVRTKSSTEPNLSPNAKSSQSNLSPNLNQTCPSFRIFEFKKRNRMQQQKPEHSIGHQMVFTVKFNVEVYHCSPTLSRDNSTRRFESKFRSEGFEELKMEGFLKEALQKYLKLIKPLYAKASKRYTDKAGFSGEGFVASLLSSPYLK